MLHGTDRIAIGDECIVNGHVTLSAGPISADPDSARQNRVVPARQPIVTIGVRCVLGRKTEIIVLTVSDPRAAQLLRLKDDNAATRQRLAVKRSPA